MRTRIALSLFSILIASAPLLAFAQLADFSTLGTSLSIAMSPSAPRPGQQVQLTLQGNGVDIQASSIVWFADGSVVAQGTGIDTITVSAGSLGSTKHIDAELTTPDGTARSAQATIAPTALDLLVSSDSYVPPFYLGRALPSAGTDLVAQAVAQFVRADGSTIPDSSITFTWKQDGQVLGSLSGRGRSSAVIPMQHMYGGGSIAVTAVSADGTRTGEASVQLQPVTPILDLYEDHSLYGMRYNLALPSLTRIADAEMAFRAITYFMPARSPADSALSYAWTVNGAAVQPSSAQPNEITINADNSNGQARIALELTHASNYYLDATGAWNVQLSAPTIDRNPFTSSF